MLTAKTARDRVARRLPATICIFLESSVKRTVKRHGKYPSIIAQDEAEAPARIQKAVLPSATGFSPCDRHNPYQPESANEGTTAISLAIRVSVSHNPVGYLLDTQTRAIIPEPFSESLLLLRGGRQTARIQWRPHWASRAGGADNVFLLSIAFVSSKPTERSHTASAAMLSQLKVIRGALVA